MNEMDYKALIDLIEQMIQAKVQLIHGGQIIDWEETKIPEMIQKIKKNLEFKNKSIRQDIEIRNN